MDEIPAEKWTTVAPELTLPELNNLERDGVTIQCLNSSEFIIGKQINFNGPVTIISCNDLLQQITKETCEELTSGTLVINDKVLSQSSATKMQKLATGREKTPEGVGYKKWKLLSWVCFGVLAAFGTGFAIFFISTPRGEEQPALFCTSISNQTCLYSEFPWGGRPMVDSKPLSLPVSYVVIFQTHSDFCYDTAMCLKLLENSHLNGTNRRDCNFLLGGDGNVYEDLGWTRKNAPGGPSALRICFMGDHTDDIPTYPQVVAAKVLIRFGVEKKLIKKNYILVPSNATSPNDSLHAIYDIIKKWPNFVENPFVERPKT